MRSGAASAAPLQFLSGYVTLGFTSFLWIAEKPAAFYFPSVVVPIPFPEFLCADAFGLWHNASCQLALSSDVAWEKLLSVLSLIQNALLFSICESSCLHFKNFCRIFVDACIASLWHANTPWCSTFIFLHQGVFCLLYVFNEPVHNLRVVYFGGACIISSPVKKN